MKNQLINRETVKGAWVICAGWVVGYYLGKQIFGGELGGVPIDTTEDALVVGWWLSAYLVCRFQISIASAIPLGAAYLILFIIAALLERDWFYHDIQGAGILEILLLALMQTLVICSPILFDWLMLRAKNKWGQSLMALG